MQLIQESMLGKVLVALVALTDEVLGSILTLCERLAGDDGALWLTELKRFLRKESCWLSASVPAPTPVILRLVSEGQEIIVSACDGQETIAEAGDIFTAGIDSDFARWGTNIPGQATGPTPASVYEQIENANFRKMFTSLGVDLDRLCWSQAQIKCFVRSHKKWLRSDGWVTFFLFKVGDEFFVAFVHVDAVDGPRVRVDRFSCGRVWRAERRFRVVVPQLPL